MGNADGFGQRIRHITNSPFSLATQMAIAQQFQGHRANPAGLLHPAGNNAYVIASGTNAKALQQLRNMALTRAHLPGADWCPIEEPGSEILPIDNADKWRNTLTILRNATRTPDSDNTVDTPFLRANQDAQLVLPTKHGVVMLNVDGMGGYPGGREAALAVRDRFLQEVDAAPRTRPEQFMDAIMPQLQDAIRELRQNISFRIADAVGSVAYVSGDQFIAAGHGDTMFLLIDPDGEVCKIGGKHNIAGLSPNIVLSSLGHPGGEPAVTRATVKAGTTIIALTDGAYEFEDEWEQGKIDRVDDIVAIATPSRTPRSPGEMVRDILAWVGQRDDASVTVVQALSAAQAPRNAVDLELLHTDVRYQGFDVVGAVTAAREHNRNRIDDLSDAVYLAPRAPGPPRIGPQEL